MKIKWYFIAAFSLAIASAVYFHQFEKDKITYTTLVPDTTSKEDEGEEEDGMAQAMHQEFEKTKDPATRDVPKERLLIANEKQEQLFNRQKQFRTNSPVPGINWTERGPNNVGGRTRAVLYDANDVNHKKVWAGAVGGGLWFCNDITVTPVWNKVNDQFDNLAVTTIAQNPSSPLTMYFGTGEGWLNGDAIRGLGIYKSIDGGVNWAPIASTVNNSNFYYVQKIVVTTSGTILVTTRGAGLQRSTDGGLSWTLVLGSGVGGGTDSKAADIEIATDNKIYVTIGLTYSAGGGIFRSSDDGATFATIYTAEGDEARIELATAPQNAGIIYALVQSIFSFGVKKIIKTSNANAIPAGSVSWATIPNPSWCDAGNPSGDFTRQQAWYDLIAAVDPLDASGNTVYVGGVDIHKSTNGGSTWSQVSQWLSGCASLPYVHADIHSIIFKPGSNTEFLVGCDGGIFRTTNSGASFVDRNTSYNVTQYYSCAVHPISGTNYFLAGSQDNGTQKFTSAGLNNATTATGGDGGFCHIDQDNPAIQITSYVYNNYFVSTDGGSTFAFYHFNDGSFINPTDYDDVADILYGGSSPGNFFRWKNPAIPGIAESISGLGNADVTSVTVSPTTPNRVYFGMSDGSVRRVDNANSSSVSVSIIKPADNLFDQVSCTAIDPSNENHILVTYSNYGVVSVFESTNANSGAPTWTNVEGNLPDMPIRWVIFDPRNSDWALLATEMGVWSTDNLNGGITDWQPTNNNFAKVRVDMLQYRPSDRTLVAATHGRGLFSTVIPPSTACDASLHPAYIANTLNGNQAYRGELGMEFTVNNANGIVVKQLGAFDDGANGITGLQPGGGVRVAIFNKTTHAIVPGLDVIVIGNGDHTVANHKTKDINPAVSLPPGNYVIVAKGYNSNERNGNSGIGGVTYPPGDNGAGAITFGNQSFWGPDDPNGFNFPSTAANLGTTNRFLAGTLVFTMPCAAPPSNADLSNLVLSQGTLNPSFTPSNTNYAATVANSVSSITVTPTAADPAATIKVNGVPVSSGSPSGPITLVVGSNLINVVVTAQDGTVKPYGVNVTREPQGGGCESSPHQAYIANTSSGNQAYRGELGMEFTVNNPKGIIVKQLGAFDDGANGINGLQAGAGIRVAIFNKSSHAIVSGLDVIVTGNGDHTMANHKTKDISPAITLPPGNYVVVAKGYNSNERNGNAGIGGLTYPSGDNGGGAITFGNQSFWGPDDPNGFNYPTTASDLGTTNRFLAGTLIFTIPCGLPNNADLSNLVLSQGTLNPSFAPATTSYAASVANNVSSITVTPTASDPAATIKVNGTPVTSGSPSGPISLVVGSNMINVVVTAQDGTPKTYTIDVTRQGNSCESPPHQAYIANTTTGNQAYQGELGMDFTVNNAGGIIVKQLGAFDHQGNGVTGTQSGGIRVAIFNKTNHAIVPGLDVTITGNGDQYSQNHRMKNIPAIILPQGSYVIVAKGYNSNELNGNSGIGGLTYPPGDNGGGAITFGNQSLWGPDDPNGFNYPATAANLGTTNRFLAGTFSFTVSIPCGTITKRPNTGLQNAVTKLPELKVYPNPTNGQFTVQLSDLEVPSLGIHIIDQNGKLVQQKTIQLTGKTHSLTVPFNLNNHSAGVYLIKVISAEGIITSKIELMR